LDNKDPATATNDGIDGLPLAFAKLSLRPKH